MMVALLIAAALGFASGLRTMTAPAMILLARHHTVAGVVLSLFAACEWVINVLPTTPARTKPGPLVARLVSGAFVGWLAVDGSQTMNIVGAIVGACAAAAGTFGGYRARIAAINRFGALRAALAEDVVAIGLAGLAFLL